MSKGSTIAMIFGYISTVFYVYAFFHNPKYTVHILYIISYRTLTTTITLGVGQKPTIHSGRQFSEAETPPHFPQPIGKAEFSSSD